MKILVSNKLQNASLHSFLNIFVNSSQYVIKKGFKNVKVDEIFFNKDISSCADSFYNELNIIIGKYVPKLIIYPSKYPRWYSKDLKKLIEKKKLLIRNIKKFGMRKIT